MPASYAATRSIQLVDTSDPADPPRAPRRSFPLANNVPPTNPRINLPSPFDDHVAETATSAPTHLPPPLPNRKPGQPHRPVVDHTRAQSADSISTSSSAEISSPADISPLTNAPPRQPPPPPPPRKGALTTRTSLPIVASPSPITGSAPPLPARKHTGPVVEESPRIRELPPRHHSVADGDVPIAPNNSRAWATPSPLASSTDSLNPPAALKPAATMPAVVQSTERKAYWAHPPPPTRTIALGDKLPPARRPLSGSSSDEEEEEVKKVELLPDSSRSSRRPPTADVHSYTESYIHVPPYTGVSTLR